MPYHFVEAGRHQDLAALLADYDWIDAKLEKTDVQSVLADYDRIAGQPEITLIGRALRLSTHALARDPDDLSAQFTGRLSGFREPRIRALVDKARTKPGGPWLCPRTASLIPSGPLLQTFTGHTDAVSAVAVLPDGRVVSGSWNWSVILWDVQHGIGIAAFVGDAEIIACAVGADRIVAGSENGAVHILELRQG